MIQWTPKDVLELLVGLIRKIFFVKKVDIDAEIKKASDTHDTSTLERVYREGSDEGTD